MRLRARSDIYASARLAEGYAFARPPVHPLIVRMMAAHFKGRVRRALDIGCGAGLSTAALQPVAEAVVGLDPSLTMLTHSASVAPQAHFVAGRAEVLPFGVGSFDLITAAGSLNYADLEQFLPEASRVLSRDGELIVYDFSAARRFRDSPQLEKWFELFETRYPFPPGYDFDVTDQPYPRFGLQLHEYRPFEVTLPMTLEEYVRYAMSETNVEQAVVAGADANDVESWCRATLRAFFSDRPREILFDGYIARIARAGT